MIPLHRKAALVAAVLGASMLPATAQIRHLERLPSSRRDKLYITLNGGLHFAPTTLTGHVQILRAAEAPWLRLSYPRSDGFHVALQTSNFRSPSGDVIANTQLEFTARNGEIAALDTPGTGADSALSRERALLFDGAVIDPTLRGSGPLPRETGTSGTLGDPLVILTGPPGSRGEFTYHLDPEEFQLRIPANAHKGQYEASLTVTLAPGP